MLFDAQVNYGKSAIGPDCSIELYLDAMRGKVQRVMLIPSPTHEHVYPDGTKEVSCLWECRQGLQYTTTLERNGAQRVIHNPLNPYERFNAAVIERAESLSKETGIEFLVAMKHHPKLDTREGVSRLLQSPTVRAVKIHGLATHTGPADLQPWLTDLAHEHGVPLFIHTDYCPADGSIDPLHRLMRENNARAWYDVVKRSGVRAFLAHGLRLDTALLEEVRDDPAILVGVGPVSLLQHERDRLATDAPYLEHLLKHTSWRNIAFCTDYRWNIQKRGEWDGLDWTSDEQLATAAMGRGLGEREIRAMLHDNATAFFSRN